MAMVGFVLVARGLLTEHIELRFYWQMAIGQRLADSTLATPLAV